jgi:predicted PurR-regulated permease PerM
MTETSRDLTRIVLAVLSIGGLIASSFWIVRPFLGSIIWATTIVVATWPLMRALQARLWNKRGLAVAVLTLALLSLFIVPFTLAISTLLSNADSIQEWARSLSAIELPPPPPWIESLPVIGEKIATAWRETIASGVEGLGPRLSPYIGALAKWLVGQVGSLGATFVQFLLTVVFTAILYTKGEVGGDWIRRFAHRLSGPAGEQVISVAGQAIRAVALGVVVTALLQSLVGGISLALAGVPFAPILTVVMFILAIAQVGAVPVLLPAVVWLYWSGSSGRGTFLLICTLVVGMMDNFLRPLLIKKGADLPLLLIFAGVMGGLIAFGLIGIFIGPVVLVVTFRLLERWITDRAPAGAAAG